MSWFCVEMFLCDCARARCRSTTASRAVAAFASSTFSVHEASTSTSSASDRIASVLPYVPAMEAPLQPGLPLIGSLLDVQRDPLALFSRASRLGDVVEIKLPRFRTFLVNRSDLIEHVLHDKYK